MVKISVAAVLLRPTNGPRDFRPAMTKFINGTVAISEHSSLRRHMMYLLSK